MRKLLVPLFIAVVVLVPAASAAVGPLLQRAQAGKAQGGPGMLSEIPHIRQRHGESPRRWFEDDFFDLIVWLNASQAILGFQLVYDKGRAPRALTWCQDDGYGHYQVEDGEPRPGQPKAAPLLRPDGPFDRHGIGEAFAYASAHIDPAIAQFVRHKIGTYAGSTSAP